MSKDRQRLIDYLAHMLEAIERIDRYTGDVDELLSTFRATVLAHVVPDLIEKRLGHEEGSRSSRAVYNKNMHNPAIDCARNDGKMPLLK